ncbi:hypothetical protein [Streptomyces sp. RKAG337]|uniref:hypothetical protein n=1 Tax=Streptomyces sp. RKAG337 TaxID=2893404 RepID=UPI0020346E3A|nr:hypothetical protein [Streptomyces sp. RKAG337]MCM2424853.1 hypothetical protein [Streptomyces sp. RKAG337]
MRKILLATAATACLALTACNGTTGGDADPKPTPTATPSAGQPATPLPSATVSPSTPTDNGSAAQALGTSARTVGAKFVGIVEITPTNVVHARAGDGQTSRYGTFVVITTLDASLSANAADEETTDGTVGGWQWIGSNGQTVSEGKGNAFKVSIAGYDSLGRIEPGARQNRAEIFDLTPEQAKGGTLVYTDSTKASYRWKIPAADAGPDVAAVKQRLG